MKRKNGQRSHIDAVFNASLKIIGNFDLDRVRGNKSYVN